MAKPSNFIQWKGTEVCMDFGCKCGYFGHIDATFAYFIKCPECKTMYKMGNEVTMEETTEKVNHFIIPENAK